MSKNYADRRLRQLAGFVSCLGLAACSASHFASEGSSTLASTSTAAPTVGTVGQISLAVKDQSGSVIYADSIANSSLKLRAGQTYHLQILGTAVPAGTAFDLQSTRTDIMNASAQHQTLALGDNTVTVPNQGSYAWKISNMSSTVNVSPRSYQAEVSCANPSLSASQVNANQIQVTAAGPNRYNFSAASAISGNGYQCAWDMTGTGIRDTDFADCSQVASRLYTNDVGTRTIGLIVRDTCNSTVTVTKSVNLAYTEPALGQGNVFIFGQMSNGSGTAATDSRLKNVTYLADNVGKAIVQAHYSHGSFVIQSSQNYGLLSSVNFGVKIELGGITDNLDLSVPSGNVNVASAVIRKLTFTTDQAGDQAPAMSFTGTQCTLSQQGAHVVAVTGQPCSSGSGDNHKITVEVYGHYSCAISSATGAATFAGDFDGYDTWADSCSGGGGGGGGLPPVNL